MQTNGDIGMGARGRKQRKWKNATRFLVFLRNRDANADETVCPNPAAKNGDRGSDFQIVSIGP